MTEGYHQDLLTHSTSPDPPATMLVLPISHVPLVLMFGILWGRYPTFRSFFSLSMLAVITFYLPQMGLWWNYVVAAYTALVICWPEVHNNWGRVKMEWCFWAVQTLLGEDGSEWMFGFGLNVPRVHAYSRSTLFAMVQMVKWIPTEIWKEEFKTARVTKPHLYPHQLLVNLTVWDVFT